MPLRTSRRVYPHRSFRDDAHRIDCGIEHAIREKVLRGRSWLSRALRSEMLPLADRLLISEVALEVENADAFFPKVDLAGWRLTGERLLRPAGPECRLWEYLRRD